ncbi:MAG: hypothetical protein PWQ22_630 [Archaeoglobaceae archaeon]|nr:hypothetical protein [Archaeoglobaceae archaeon]MDK2876220.1 hypothetical protein [Archaeoglobaceae archaeon]
MKIMKTLKVKIGRRAFWKVLVAGESKEVYRGRIDRLKVEEVWLPPNTMIAPLNIARHAFGTTINVYTERLANIEEDKKIVEVVFASFDNGKVEKGDVVGVLKVFPSHIFDLELKEVRFPLKRLNASMVYRDDNEIKRSEISFSEGEYARWHIGEWVPLVSEESLELKKGEVTRIKIRRVEIPEETIPTPLSISRNAFGSVLDVLAFGRPRKVEERRVISETIFMPYFNGFVQPGDLLGVLNIYYVSTGMWKSLMFQTFSPTSANLVYWKNRDVVRKKIDINPFFFKRSEIATFEPVVADEDKKLEAGVNIVRIKEIIIPGGTIIQPLSGINKSECILLDLFSEKPLLVEEDKFINRAAVYAFEETSVKEGALLGAVAVYNVSILLQPELFFAKYRK